MPFTRNDTEAIVGIIEADLALAVQIITEADPATQAVVLTGAFSRGEGAVVDGRPQNDYDLVAFRNGLPRPQRYATIRTRLESALGLHVDLAPVATWRLPRVSRSIFWYETALRGRTLWGKDLLPRIPVRNAAELDRGEGMRLLANRAAGLLLSANADERERLIQAAKALLAAGDARLLAAGCYPPSQTERQSAVAGLVGVDNSLRELEADLAWAFAFKTRPDAARRRDATEAWQVAARAVTDAVPVALAHAGSASLAHYERSDRWLDTLAYRARAARVPGSRWLARHPTGRIRTATLRLLALSIGGRVDDEAARELLRPVADAGPAPLATLARLRAVTLQ